MYDSKPENLQYQSDAVEVDTYKTVGSYLLAYCVAHTGKPHPPLMFANAIAKRELHVREAWEIGRHDVDCAGIHPDDDPIIPADHPDAPVPELIRWKRER